MNLVCIALLRGPARLGTSNTSVGIDQDKPERLNRLLSPYIPTAGFLPCSYEVIAGRLPSRHLQFILIAYARYVAPEQNSLDGTEGSASLDASLEATHTLVADMRERARKETERADAVEMLLLSTEQELSRANRAIEGARQEAASILETTKREAEAIRAEARRGIAGATAREAELVEAMRSYLCEIEESQSTLLRIARRALSALAALGPADTQDESAAHPRPPSKARTALPKSSPPDSTIPPIARTHGDDLNGSQLVVANSASSSIDGLRLIDISNQQDLDRLDERPSVKNLFRGL